MNKLFGFVWRRWLGDGSTVVRVTGWRSCIWERNGQRMRGTICLLPWE